MMKMNLVIGHDLKIIWGLGDGSEVKSIQLFLQRTLVHFPAPKWQLTTIWNPSSRYSDALFWPLKEKQV